MSDLDKEYLNALKKRAEMILSIEEKPKKESKSEMPKEKLKTKREQTEEQRQAVLERLAQARIKANETRQIKKKIKEEQLKEKHAEFESLKKKYLKPTEQEEPKEPKKPPFQRVRATIEKEEVKPEPTKEEPPKPEPVKTESIPTSKPIDIVKPKEEKKEEIVINTPQPERTFYIPRLKYIKKHNLFY